MKTRTSSLQRLAIALLGAASACSTSMSGTSTMTTAGATAAATTDAGTRLARYSTVKLAPDLAPLSDNERKMIPLLVDAAKAIDDVFWIQAYGDAPALLQSITDPAVRRLAELNYGPWDRLDNHHPIVPHTGARPGGANYYPTGMNKAEFEAEIAKGGAHADSLKSLYTMVRRDAAGHLTAIPFSKFFAAQHERAARRLDEAAARADDRGLRNYLTASSRRARPE